MAAPAAAPTRESARVGNYDIWWIVKPSHLLFWLVAAGGLLLLLGRGRRLRSAGRLLAGTGLAALFMVCFTPLPILLIQPLENRFPPPPADAPAPDGIIVLAGAEQVKLSALHGVPHLNAFADRLTTFVVLARRHAHAQLIHSGRGGEHEGTTQSTIARDVLQAALPDRELILEDRSRDTHQAAVEVARLLGPRADGERWWLVTSAFHMPRAVASFRAAGLDVVAYPVDRHGGTKLLSRPDATSHLEAMDWTAHEWLGLLWYRAHGYTREVFPAPRDRPQRHAGRESETR